MIYTCVSFCPKQQPSEPSQPSWLQGSSTTASLPFFAKSFQSYNRNSSVGKVTLQGLYVHKAYSETNTVSYSIEYPSQHSNSTRQFVHTSFSFVRLFTEVWTWGNISQYVHTEKQAFLRQTSVEPEATRYPHPWVGVGSASDGLNFNKWYWKNLAGMVGHPAIPKKSWMPAFWGTFLKIRSSPDTHADSFNDNVLSTLSTILLPV